MAVFIAEFKGVIFSHPSEDVMFPHEITAELSRERLRS